MLDNKQIYETYMQLKKVLFIEKDKDGNIVSPTDKDTLKLYKEILQSNIKNDSDQYYHKNSKSWYQKISKDIVDPETNEVHTLDFFEDITKIKEAERILKIDALTNLINDRNESNKMINEYINEAANRHEEFSLIMADLDYFKAINDTYGHECGDLVLEQIGKLLLKNTRQSDDKFDYGVNDIVIRIGGDEFLILLKNISLDNTKKKLEDLSKKVSDLSVFYGETPIDVDMSFGYYHVGKNDMKTDLDIEKTRKTISKKADEYLYINKNRKKETYLNMNKIAKKQKGMK